MIFIYLVLKGRSGNIFQKRVEEEARGLSVCSDPRLRQAIVNRSQENASAFAFGGDFSIRCFFKKSCEQLSRWGTRWPARGCWRRPNR